ncbi:family 1 glycosylhydrolase [candidate division NPL-UPA2 bacterium]|nr:family 1 glycosylhydrolase [candidate division NPL-UPA2 bacterium]
MPFPDGYPKTDMGWNIVPDCIYYGLKFISKRYNIPKFYITENGAAFKDVLNKGEVHDRKRIEYLNDHLLSAHRAISGGINLVGYFVWTLLDNFEWNYGYSKRFGIVYVDHKSQNKILKERVHYGIKRL